MELHNHQLPQAGRGESGFLLLALTRTFHYGNSRREEESLYRMQQANTCVLCVLPVVCLAPPKHERSHSQSGELQQRKQEDARRVRADFLRTISEPQELRQCFPHPSPDHQYAEGKDAERDEDQMSFRPSEEMVDVNRVEVKVDPVGHGVG